MKKILLFTSIASLGLFALLSTNFQSKTTKNIYVSTLKNVSIDDQLSKSAAGSISGFVWEDYNANGKQDLGEPGIPDVTITLTGTDNVGVDIIKTTMTSGNGIYVFNDPVPATDYQITFTQPADIKPTLQAAAGTVDGDDSDYDPSNLMTSAFEVMTGDEIIVKDGGFFGEDFGDNPTGFATGETDNGPRHVIQPGKFLGAGVDADNDGVSDDQSGTTGTGGDDNTASNYSKGTVTGSDEDGIQFITPMIPGKEACIEVTYTADSGDNYLTGWIDFSGDGMFDTNEQLEFNNGSARLADQLLPLGANIVTEYCFDVPADALFDGGETHTRFRMSCETGVQPTGRLIGGEVEDYWQSFAKIGNLVWKDVDFAGAQVDTLPNGINDFTVELVYGGRDGDLSTTDDNITYEQVTSTIDDIDGSYYFCGLIDGTYRVQYSDYPSNMISTISNYSNDATDFDDSDADFDFVDFMIANTLPYNLPTDENGPGDTTRIGNFPDDQTDFSIDFGFIEQPSVAGSFAIQGVAPAASGTCGQMNATYLICIKNTGKSPLENLQATIDFSAADAFGDAFVGLVGTPVLESSTAQTNPRLDANFDAAGDDELLRGNNGLLNPEEQVCYYLTVELEPGNANAPTLMKIQPTVSAEAVNFDGTPIPDILNGLTQFSPTDLTDHGTEPGNNNPGFFGDTGGEDDPTFLNDCWSENGTPACNNNVQVSLDDDGKATLFGSMIVQGMNTGCTDLPLGDYFDVQISNNGGNLVDCRDIGRDFDVVATHVLNCNSCWGTVTVEDKRGPIFNCSVELLDDAGKVVQSGDTINIDCSIDLASISAPTAVDNCSQKVDVFLNAETSTGDDCDILTVTRVYEAKDQDGNKDQGECMITINISQPEDVTFPEDVTWSCEQYSAFANIVEPTPLHPLILAEAAAMDLMSLNCLPGMEGDDVPDIAPFEPGTEYWSDAEDLDVNLDPNYDDNIDNPITGVGGECGVTTSESDAVTVAANFSYMVGCPYLSECDLNAGGHSPDLIQVPIFGANSMVQGLEDADVLAATGSGEPNVASTPNCNFAVTYEDKKLEACNGLGTDGATFKILRTWTVLNWCTGKSTSDIQAIKVLDNKAPVIRFAEDYNETLVANLPGCLSNNLIDPPLYQDNCTGITTIRVFTPVGEAMPVENAGVIIGYQIPSPYLEIGTHKITYQMEDGCGNESFAEKTLQVIDGIPPIPICRELTQIALSADTDGVTVVSATSFNVDSYDFCGRIYFKVRREERPDCDGFATDRTRFNDEIHFCCTDIGDTVKVILRVYDVDPGVGQVTLSKEQANSNECVVNVLVEDQAHPQCVPPDDVWINCDEIADNEDLQDIDVLTRLFGSAFAADNCSASISELAPNLNVDLCGNGMITRSFRATDAGGNNNFGNCRQTVMIMPISEYTLIIPGDFEEECDDAAPQDLEYEEVGCDLLAISTEDNKFYASDDGECLKILRTWRVINWCEYDGISPISVIPRLDINEDGVVGDGKGGSRAPINFDAVNEWTSTGDDLIFNPDPSIRVGGGGYYEYEQQIKIFDNTAPELEYTGNTQFCGGLLDEDPCTGAINILPNVNDLCTDTEIRWEMSSFSDKFTSTDFNGINNLTGQYPLGTHTVRFYVNDECGNISQIDITFSIVDCKAPSPVCHNGLSIEIMPRSKMVEVWASDYDASSFDYCHPFELRINRVTDMNGDGAISAIDYLTTPPAFDSVQFVCSDVGNFVQVQLWVGEISADTVNNWAFCLSFMEVQDNNNVCSSTGTASITGVLKTEIGENVANVNVSIGGAKDATLTTDNSGEFNFTNLNQGSDYSVTPMKNDGAANGVSTFDLIKISKHILNVEKLDSPYKIIAADANNSGNISTLDLIAIRKVILRVANEFPNNTSWRFVATDQVLDENPLDDALIEAKNFNNILADAQADFVAIKTGDVNGDAEPTNSQSVDGRTFENNFILKTKEVEFEKGERLEVEFSSEEMPQIAGYQFTMHFDTKALSLVEIQESTATQQNFGQAFVENGILTASWNPVGTSDRATIDDKGASKAFKLIFETKSAGKLSELMTVSSQITAAEAYRNDGTFLGIGLDFETDATTNEFELFQNAPNPFETETVIGFNLPEATTATVTVSDVSGKILKIIKGDYTKGYNEIRFESTNDLPTGILIYELETATNKASRRMSVIK